MHISTVLNTKYNVIQKIIYHIELFESFKNVYLFGSIINETKVPNDIDLLLIYKDFSNEIFKDLDKISAIFSHLCGLSFDLTILSEHEEKETNFIVRLKSNYLRIK